MWYRLAIRDLDTGVWEWVALPPTRSMKEMNTILSYPFYQAARDRLFLFEAEREEDLSQMLWAKNNHRDPKEYVQGAPVLPERLELENQRGGDHDQPYRYELPQSALAFSVLARLMTRFRNGEFASDDPL